MPQGNVQLSLEYQAPPSADKPEENQDQQDEDYDEEEEESAPSEPGAKG